MSKKSFMGYYVGEEFPEYYGKKIEIKHDNSNKKYPCYKIRFIDESIFYDNMDDEDFQLVPPQNNQ